MTSLFEYQEKYPNAPGYRRAGTSQEAAEAVAPRFTYLQALVLEAIRQYGPLTPDECARKVDEDKLSIRPRFTELVKLGKIVETGERRRNPDSKRKANVYRIA